MFPAAKKIRRDVPSFVRARHEELRGNIANLRNDGEKEIADAYNFQFFSLLWTVVPGL